MDTSAERVRLKVLGSGQKGFGMTKAWDPGLVRLNPRREGGGGEESQRGFHVSKLGDHMSTTAENVERGLTALQKKNAVTQRGDLRGRGLVCAEPFNPVFNW